MLAEIQPGTLIGHRYLINKLLGKGGFGRTYLVYDTQRFGEPCVLKEFVPPNTSERLLNKYRDLFEREAKVLYQINHPQIPKFLAWLTEEERLFIVQEYIDGRTYSQLLRDRLSQQKKPFSEAEVIQWLLELLSVLDYLHQLNIIHRDIAPDNVIHSQKQSKPVLIDFGIVKQKVSEVWNTDPENDQHSVMGSVVGKIGYSPPEQLRMGQCYPCSDLYALAVSAIVLMTGKMPNLLLDPSLKWKWRSYAQVSPQLGEILEKMLAENPLDRYQSAKEVIDELQSCSHLASGNSDAILLEQKVQTDRNSELKTAKTGEAKDNTPEKQKFSDIKTSIENTLGINSEFLASCQEELTSFVGPFASVLLKNTLNQFPQLTPNELVERLAVAIPHPERSREFRNRAQILLSQTGSPQETTLFQDVVTSFPAANDPEFLQYCRKELVSFVGPFATVLIEDTIANNPNITPEQLVEVLVAKIPHQQRAQEFRNRIQIKYKS
ncbi:MULTISPECIES: serine/threonine-protein kinase [Nostocales]|uniref:non-specific serine/threonine protein kinase n=5 Tax=Nostocales TaxID=1161 RepID=A0A8S9T907_9CYAN|nr:serine/threonine-protein kinase [Tolypothrix bouteillei]KAF3888112.1 serine/threonine protein kinase [Tolypothrix bouteillei VB521301]